MNLIDWKKLTNFKKKEFLHDPDIYAEPQLIHNLQESRDLIKNSIYPSTVSGSFVRFGGSKTSQHYVGEDSSRIVRKTTAIDVFPEGLPISNFSLLFASRLFKGIGIYLDTIGIDGTPWVMFHLDIRKRGYTDSIPLFWIAEKVLNDRGELVTKYRYPQVQPEYWDLMKDDKLYQYKNKEK